MSEQPRDGQPFSEPEILPAQPRPPRWSGPPRWPRRKGLIAAGALVVTAIAIAVSVTARSAAGQAEYTRLPSACDLVPEATLAKYVPGGLADPRSAPSDRTHKAGTCAWITDTADVTVHADIYDSSDGLALAQQAYRKALPADCTCHGITITGQSVTGLGDQASARFMASNSAARTYGQAWSTLTVTVGVRSGNAVVIVTYEVAPPFGHPPPPRPANAALLTDTVAMARDVLVSLARPAAVVALPSTIPSGATTEPEPHFAGTARPCSLIKAATLARYAPGAEANTQSPAEGVGLVLGCIWVSQHADVVLELNITANPASAVEQYVLAVGDDTKTSDDQTFHGTQPVKGIGQQATAVFQTMPEHISAVTLEVWSGNAEFSVILGDQPSSKALSPAAKLAGAIAMAREVLADLPR